MNLTRTICQLHDAESKLAEALRDAGNRHGAILRGECESMALQAGGRVAAVAAWATRWRGQPWEVDGTERTEPLLTALRWRRRASDRRRPSGGSPLLRDVRRLHHLAEDCQLHWARVGCGARRGGAVQLLDLVAIGHEDLGRTIRRLTSLMETAVPRTAPAT